jgi:agmatinase
VEGDTGSRLGLPYTGIVTFLRSAVCEDLTTLDADIAVIGMPNDEGTGWLPGSRFGPRRLREASVRFAGSLQGRPGFWDIDEGRRYLAYEIANGRIVDCGDVDIMYTRPDLTWDNATRMVRGILAAGAMPVVLGGDHSATYPVVRAYDSEVAVLHFDAHVDYQPFVHGIVHSYGNPIRMVRQLPHVSQITQVGIRSFRTNESDVADSLAAGNAVVTTNQLRLRGPDAFLDTLPAGCRVYVSIDIDVLDIALVPGTGTPEPDGLSYRELRDALLAVATRHEVVGVGLVEVNPMLDVPSQATSFTATQLLIEFLCRLVEHPGYRERHRPTTTS